MAKKTKPQPLKKKVVVEKPEVLPPEIPEEAQVLPQIERLANMGKMYAGKLDQSSASGIYTRYWTLTTPQLQAIFKNPNITEFEKSAINLIIKSRSNAKDALAAKMYLDDRMFGKMSSKTEITGAKGGPVQIENDIKLQLERKLTVMSDEDMETFEQHLLKARGIAMKDDDGSSETN